MAQVVGKYIAENDEHLSAYFKAHGLNDEQLQGVLNVFKELEIKTDGNEYSIIGGLGDRSFPLETEFDERLCDDNLFKSTASISGNKLVIRALGHDGKIRERVYEAFDNGLVLILNSAYGDYVKVYYKRV